MKRHVPALWLCLLTPEAIERLEQREDFCEPHPDFPAAVDNFFACPNCSRVHWERTRITLDARRGELMIGFYRDQLSEVTHLFDADDPDPVKQLARQIAAKTPTLYAGHEPLGDYTPASFTEDIRTVLHEGAVMYLREVKKTGEDPYRFLGKTPLKPGQLKLLANAELLRRLQPEAIHA